MVTIESDTWCITKNAQALGDDDADDELVPLLHPPTITDYQELPRLARALERAIAEEPGMLDLRSAVGT